MDRTPACATAILAALAVAGCGTQVAASGAPGASGAPPGSGAPAAARHAGGGAGASCASVDLATKVTALRTMHVVEPARLPAQQRTSTNAAQVQALFRDLCAIVAHPDQAVYHCPMDAGVDYAGAFYAGDRVLATYTFSVSGCQRVTLTDSADGQTRAALVAGQAAPSLDPDFAKVVGDPVQLIFRAGGGPHQGG